MLQPAEQAEETGSIYERQLSMQFFRACRQ
jgi:hypothetical protein